jgi:ABC-type Fe3+ transport system substrate-binding protein
MAPSNVPAPPNRTNVRFWHKADICLRCGNVPLLGVKRTLTGHVPMAASDQGGHDRKSEPTVRKVLERHGIWQTISGGKECMHWQTTNNNWFTAVHHRETPDRIMAKQSDAGMVWQTEVLAALRGGARVEAVALPDDDSLRTEVSYTVGMLTGSKHREAAAAFLSFLRSPEGQDAYAKFGFVRASDAELHQKPIP